MSSIEEQPLSENSGVRPGIRLSTLNPQVREKLVKFDTANDGELSIEEAIQGLVTLQKQSNNYKRMLYFIVPLMTIMLACVLGVNILAIQLTKDLSTSTNSGNPTLTNTDGKVLATSSYTNSMGMLDWLMNYGYSPMEHIEIDELSMNVNSMYLEEQNNITRLYVNTQMLYFYFGSDGTYALDFNQGYNTNIFALKAFNVVDTELKIIQENIVNLQSQFKNVVGNPKIKVATSKPTPRARSQFGCSLIPAKCN